MAKRKIKSPTDNESLLLTLFLDLVDGEDLAEFLDHIGFDWTEVPPTADAPALFQAFKRHYTGPDGDVNADRPGEDLVTFPPIASAIIKADLQARHAADGEKV